MIARLSKRIASFFVLNNVIQNEDTEVYEYGLQILLSTVINGTVALAISVLSGAFIQCIIFLAVFVIMRKTAGGYHAVTHLRCCFTLVIVLSLFIAYIKCASIESYMPVSLLSVIISMDSILLYAPLEHKNKPIEDFDKIRLRKLSILYISIIAMSVVFLYMFKQEQMMVCISLGAFASAGSILAAKITNYIKNLHLGTKNRHVVLNLLILFEKSGKKE